MTVPYAPTAFPTPLINPQVGGFGAPVPYISISQYKFAPTAMTVDSLVQTGNSTAQTQALADTIRRASAWADRYCFGADPASKGASLCATESVESAYVKVLQGELRLICSYKPIVQVNGIDVGWSPGSVRPLDPQIASTVRIGAKTLYVPARAISTTVGGLSDSLPMGQSAQGRRYAVWSYVNGYAHTFLAATVTAGARDITLWPTAPTGLYGVYPGSQLTIEDSTSTESFTVASVDGNVLTSSAPFLNDHRVPDPPDFIPVTALPSDVGQAVIFLTTGLIKTRGDTSLTLDELTEPTTVKAVDGGVDNDIATAYEMLDPFRVTTKVKS